MRDVHRFLEVLNLLGYGRSTTRLVLNHCYHRSEVNVKDLERALGHPIVQEIEYSPNQVTASLNRGVPLVEEYRDSAAARSITRLAQLLVESTNARSSLDTEEEPADEKKKSKRRGLFSQRKAASA
jgi:Flp pilus assembly CpaE family ATPase